MFSFSVPTYEALLMEGFNDQPSNGQKFNLQTRNISTVNRQMSKLILAVKCLSI